MRRLLCVAAACAALWQNAPVLAASEPQLDYQRGVSAAREGAFDEALRHFQAARRAGLTSPTLAYNLGVVHYRLGQLEAARAAFLELTDDPRWKALAHYNLGLIEERAGRSSSARSHYRRAHALADQPRLRALAEHKLDGGAADTVADIPTWHGLVSLGTGFDDNAILADDQLLETVSDESDLFLETLAVARRPISGEAGDGITLDLGGYYRAHADLADFDFGVLSAALLWDVPVGDWDLSTGMRAEAQFVGGGSYAQSVTQRLEVERRQDNITWGAGNDLSYVSGASDFDHVTGWRNRTRLQMKGQGERGTFTVGLALELNDREDLAQEEEFFSYSPLRHQVFARLRTDLGDRLRVEVDGALGRSRYEDANRFLDDAGTLTEAERDQDVVSLGLRADYRLGAQWHLWAAWQNLDSESDISRYAYRSNRYLFGVEAAF